MKTTVEQERKLRVKEREIGWYVRDCKSKDKPGWKDLRIRANKEFLDGDETTRGVFYSFINLILKREGFYGNIVELALGLYDKLPATRRSKFSTFSTIRVIFKKGGTTVDDFDLSLE